MDSVADYVKFSPNQLYWNLAQVCWGRSQGHQARQPSCLVNGDFCLEIIDFDMAMQVKDENEDVNDQYGTKRWMAPEIDEKLMYSPIKADRWSTGLVLLYLEESGKEEELMMAIAWNLTAHDPKQRPSMLGVAAALSDVDNVAGERKASRSRQDREEVDGESAKSSRVKKQKLSNNN